MKKLILPVLICVVALTSCSKALYKDKYDWVKVDRRPTYVLRDSLIVIEKPSATKTMEVIGSDVELTSETVAGFDSVPLKIHSVEETTLQTTALKREALNDTAVTAAETIQKSSMVNDEKNRKQNSRKSKPSQPSSHRDWGKIATWVFGIALISFFLYFALGPATFAILAGSVLVIFLVVLAVIALVAWLICQVLESLVIACFG